MAKKENHKIYHFLGKILLSISLCILQPSVVLADYFYDNPIASFSPYPVPTYSSKGRPQKDKLSKKQMTKNLRKIIIKGMDQRKGLILIELPYSTTADGKNDSHFIKMSHVLPRDKKLWAERIGRTSKDFVCFKPGRAQSAQLATSRDTSSAGTKGLADVDC